VIPWIIKLLEAEILTICILPTQFEHTLGCAVGKKWLGLVLQKKPVVFGSVLILQNWKRNDASCSPYPTRHMMPIQSSHIAKQIWWKINTANESVYNWMWENLEYEIFTETPHRLSSSFTYCAYVFFIMVYASWVWRKQQLTESVEYNAPRLRAPSVHPQRLT